MFTFIRSYIHHNPFLFFLSFFLPSGVGIRGGIRAERLQRETRHTYNIDMCVFKGSHIFMYSYIITLSFFLTQVLASEVEYVQSVYNEKPDIAELGRVAGRATQMCASG